MSVRKSVFWSVTGQFFSIATALGTSIIIARFLTPHEMGIYAVGFATLGALQVFTAFDLATYIVRAKVLEPDTLAAAFTVNAALLVGLAFLTFLGSYAAARLLDEPAVAHVLQFLTIGLLISIFEFRPVAMLRREMRFRLISLITLGKTIASSVTAVMFVTSGASFMSLAYGNVAYAAFGALAFNLVAREHAGLRFSIKDWRAMTTFGLQMMSVSGLANLVGRISDILLGKMLGLASLGLYSRASTTASLLFHNVYGAATQVVFVKLAEDYRQTGILRHTFLRGIQMLTAVMWPLLIGLAVLSQPVILLMFGSNWVPAAIPLSLLLIAQFIVLGFGMNWELFVLREETARQIRIEVLRATIGLALFAIGCAISLTAAAASRIIEALIALLLYHPHVNRLAGTTVQDLTRIYGQSVLLTLVAITPVLVLMLWNGWSAETPWSSILPAILLGIGLWLGTLKLIAHPLHDELSVMVGRLRRKHL